MTCSHPHREFTEKGWRCYDCSDVSSDAVEQLEMYRKVVGWKPIETALKGRKIIAGYYNELGNWRSVMARYYLPKTLAWNTDYDGGDEDGFAPEGWYEEIENSEIIFPMATPTHWQPLPEPPRTIEEQDLEAAGSGGMR